MDEATRRRLAALCTEAAGKLAAGDEGALQKVVAEANRISGGKPDPNAENFYDDLRRTLAAARERDKQAAQRRKETLKKHFG